MISFQGDPATAAGEGGEDLEGLTVHFHRFRGPRLRRIDLRAASEFRPDLIHCRNSRLPTVAATKAYAGALRAPIFVHWMDDEWSSHPSPPWATSSALRHVARRTLGPVHPPFWNFSTSSSLRWATGQAAAFDALSPALAAEVRKRTERECAVILPTSPPEAWTGGGAPAPKLPPVTTGTKVLLYTGDINYGREQDIRLGLAAIADAQRRGQPITFVHAGRHTAPSSLEELATEAGLRPGSAVTIGTLPFEQIPALLRQGAILLQPGHPSALNRLGLPSKLQAYLASGTPVITFAAGPGELLRDRVEVLKTYTASPAELADRICELLEDESLRETLSANAPTAARRLFDPVANVDALLAHYRSALGTAADRGTPLSAARDVHRGLRSAAG